MFRCMAAEPLFDPFVFVEAALVLSMQNIQDDLRDVPLPYLLFVPKPRLDVGFGGEEPRRVLAAGVGAAPAEG